MSYKQDVITNGDNNNSLTVIGNPDTTDAIFWTTRLSTYIKITNLENIQIN